MSEKQKKMEEHVQLILAQVKNNESEYTDGWFDLSGNFYGIPAAHHEDYNDAFKLVLNREHFLHFYQKWIKVSVLSSNSVAFYVGQHSAQIMNGNIVTPYQKVGIEKFLNRHNLLGEGCEAVMHGYGDCYREGHQIKFKKLKI